MCDHKIDNVLYDIETNSFYITDLEAITSDTASCDILTFVDQNIYVPPFIFDHMHFLGSVYDVPGMSREFESISLMIAEYYHPIITQHLNRKIKRHSINITLDYIIISVIVVSLFRLKINEKYISQLCDELRVE